MSEEDLPNYERPPVVETILGVQFDPIAGLRTAHLGAFWASLGEEWPVTDEAPPLEPRFETFDDGAPWAELGLRLKLGSPGHIRIQIQNADRSRMIQLQNGRLIYNWLGTDGAPYPRYSSLREEFRETLERFRRFLEHVRLPSPSANQWEITYINHIPRGTVWKCASDWKFFLPWRTDRPLSCPAEFESGAAEWHYVISEQRGRLHVTWQHARRNDDQEVVVLNLTARGKCSASHLEESQILEGIDLGRETIVRSFRDLMDPSANEFWGLQL